MQRRVLQLRLAFIAGYLLQGAFAGSGEQDSHFLGKRPGLNKDVQLWNDFLRSENQPDNQGPAGMPHGTTQRSAAFLDATTQGNDHLERALRSCLKKHAGPSAAMPVPVPHGNPAGVAAAAVASLKPESQSSATLLKVQLEACLETAQQDDLAEKAVPMKTVASKTTTTTLGPIIVPPNTGPHVETALVAANFSDPCANGLKQCKKDVKNCKHVLDILQFLRLQHIAVEQAQQREAQAKHGRSSNLVQSGTSLQTILEKHGFSLPKPEDWDWTDGKKLLLQSALEQHSLALIDEDWSRSPDLVHPIPVLAPAQQHQLPPPSEGTMKVSFARPVRLEIHHTRCPAHVKKELDDCGLSLQSCKVDVDDHNAILNSIAGRANKEREAKLVEYLRPPRDYSID